MGCGSRFYSEIVQRKKRFLSLLNLTKRNNERQGMNVLRLSPGWWFKCLSFSVRTTFSFVILCIMISRASLLPSKLCHLSVITCYQYHMYFTVKPGIPELDYFELVIFAFIVGVQVRTGILKWCSNERFIGLFLYGGQNDVKVST